jgi:hypothetical protein
MSPLLRAAAATLIAAVLVVPGCGNSDEQVAPTEPTIPQGVASDLAERAEEIARLLDKGNNCAAASEARELRRAARRALESGRIPEEFREPIEAAVADLQNIECTSGTGTETGAGADTTMTIPTTTETMTGAETTSTTTTAPETTTSDVTTTSSSATEGSP